jgi:DNA-binding PadR family transcriptional regulator
VTTPRHFSDGDLVGADGNRTSTIIVVAERQTAGTRAKDSDRNDTCQVLGSALAEGQLSMEEHRQRGFGDTMGYSLTIYPEYAVLSRADPSEDRRKLSYTYRGGFDDPSTSAKDEDDVLVDLAAFDVETTVGILRGAAETVGLQQKDVKPDSTYLASTQPLADGCRLSHWSNHLLALNISARYYGARCRNVVATKQHCFGEVIRLLELAVLGLLLESPMHGYELRKRLTGLLGAFRAFSYGSLYPALRRMQADGLIVEDAAPEGIPKMRRARRVYQLSDAGKQRFTELVADTGPQNFSDDGFGVHLAFFNRTPAEARMRILEGRRRQVEERREGLREAVARASSSIDRYTRQLHQLGLESSEREVKWLNELIAAERTAQQRAEQP